MIVNKPRVSRIILGFYLAVFLLVVGLLVYGVFFVGFSGVSVLLLGATALVIALLIHSILSTRYVITGDELIIRSSPLIGGSRRIRLDSILNVGRTLIPFGFKLFGASFHGGYYYIPSYGRVFMVITNFRDGVLIETRDGRFIITPRDPDEFVKALDMAREGV